MRRARFTTDSPPEVVRRKDRRREMARLRQQRRRNRMRQRKADDFSDVLIETGDLPEWDADDPEKVAEAMREHFRRLRQQLGLEA